MTIEIHRPELEALIVERMRRGSFQSVEDVLMDALTSTEPVNEESISSTSEKAAPEPFWKAFAGRVHAVPAEVFEHLPADGASEHDHYLYGSLKRNP